MTTLTQNGKVVPYELDCDFKSLGGKLDKHMAMAISTYSLDADANTVSD